MTTFRATTRAAIYVLFTLGQTYPRCQAFSPASPLATASIRSNANRLAIQSASNMMQRTHLTSRLNMMDPCQILTDASNFFSSVGTDNILSFSDQGQNLAGIFFQASLLPYLAFLYFLSFRGNRIPEIGNFGFQFLLLFVLSTIPSGIITKGTYGVSLADCDWLHGGAEALLTITNILIVFGFRRAMSASNETNIENWKLKVAAICSAVAFAGALAVGPGLGFGAHSAFLLGLGNLPSGFVESLPWVAHSEPVNALSIPTWAIHFSSVFEWIFAMNIIWNFSENSGNEKWKGLTWGMLPLHASGIAACTYHFFYNPSSLQFLVSTQAGLTLLGNITCAIAAYRIAVSNGWTLSELNPLPASKTSPKGIIVENNAAMPLQLTEQTESDAALAAKLAALTFGAAYIVKYGELCLDVPFEQNAFAAVAIVAGIPAITAFNFYNKSQLERGEGGGISFPSFGQGGGKNTLSMADVKKYGVSGTVAYVLTELAFWAVAFPVASNALYQSTGHWPDVISDATDRATVLGFIFAGANVARLLVPVRLGAALALAPWVDENIINRCGGNSSKEENA
eukprot:CAMPEP_0176487600 /NCGR_PEP_ID=MMETSP0200_2-20121128/6232_1 /TAXON_ID=947934 /ORGANISM="Chaetoceros sp., Strain GSL56" /LENGTH=567 /DNA_ID=CAMNT_0017884467 /DNA_START=132 /DNA_END=1835 /DNA_ORIENTATION=+